MKYGPNLGELVFQFCWAFGVKGTRDKAYRVYPRWKNQREDQYMSGGGGAPMYPLVRIIIKI